MSVADRSATGADHVAARLKAAGATHAFGIPGGEVLALVDALERAGIRVRLARHENAAGFIAEGLWHATGALPLLLTTIGPGVSNAVTAVAHAQQDRVPLVVLTGCLDTALAETFTHQVFDHQAVLGPLCKATFRAAPGTEGLVIDKAVAIALAGRPGPVHVDLPVAVMEARVAPPSPAPAVRRGPVVAAGLERAADVLAAARRPLVIAGLDIVNEGRAADLDRLLAHWKAPLLTTYKAKGVLPENDPRVIGGVGLSPRADAAIKPLLDAADAILLAGYDPIEMRQGWRQPWPRSTPVVDLVAADVQHGMHLSTVIAEGHVGTSLRRLAGLLPPSAGWPDDLPDLVRARLAETFTPVADWGPGVAFRTLRAAAPAGTIATADSGAHRILFSQVWACDGPRRLLQSTGLCTMGCALPLAIGAALGAGRPVLCVAGDAGLEMVMGELATARDLAVPVVVAVMADRSLGLIDLKQRQSGLPSAAVDIGGTDFAAVARGFGGHGETVADAAALAAAAHAAFVRPGLSVIACEIGARAYDGAF
jgi:acetolactate synthase-1/2/3 large subunit